MKDDLDRYINRRFGESGKVRKAYDEGFQEFLRLFENNTSQNFKTLI